MAIGGCASSGLSPLNYAVGHVQGEDRDGVFETARTALIEQGYCIKRADLAAGVITTLPVPVALPSDLGGRGTLLSSQARFRRVAQVRVSQRSGTIDVYCRVSDEEQTTEAYRMFARDRMVFDTPHETPIDREAATTTEQNTVWRTIRRDKAAERRILKAILVRLDAPPG